MVFAAMFRQRARKEGREVGREEGREEDGPQDLKKPTRPGEHGIAVGKMPLPKACRSMNLLQTSLTERVHRALDGRAKPKR